MQPGGPITLPRPSGAPESVVIGGGGIAALECAAALAALAPDRVALTLVCPDVEFVWRPLTPHQAFDYVARPRVALTELADRLGATLIHDQLGWVDRGHDQVVTRSGDRVSYQALVLGLGAVPRPRFAPAITIGSDTADASLTRLLSDVRDGRASRVAFIAPERTSWPLPLYELALMTATLAAEHHREVELTLITAEAFPVQPFGETAGAQMSELLTGRGVHVACDAHAEMPAPGTVLIHAPAATGHWTGALDATTATTALTVDRVVALPELVGPHLRGIPTAPNGFIPVDRHCRVIGTTGIYAAGDATDYPVKHGGIAAQQAVTVAGSIAAGAGAPVVAHPFHPTLEGLLLTGSAPRYLSARLTGGHPFGSTLTIPPAQATPAKVAAPHLTRLIEQIHR